MNYLFLDIDGVLNNKTYLLKQVKKRKRQNQPQKFYSVIDKHAVKLLAKAYKKHRIKIILSSSWRFGWDINCKHITELKNIFKKYNINVSGFISFDRALTRGEQIQLYIDTFLAADDRYVVLDDDSLEIDNQECFIKTDFNYGLQKEHLKRIKDILN